MDVKTKLSIAYFVISVLVITNGVFIYLWSSATAESSAGQTPVPVPRALTADPQTLTAPPSTRTYELNEEQLRTILTHMDVADLIDIADKISDLAVLITRDFIMATYNFHEKTIHIEATDGHAITIDRSQITVPNHEMAVKIVRNFGHIITKVSVNGKQFRDRLALLDIYHAIGDHCSKSLYAIAFNVVPFNPFATWRKSFEFVDTLTLTHVMEPVVDVELTSAIFPNLKTLDIFLTKAGQLRMIAKKFKNLRHFKLRLVNSTEETPFLAKFLGENSQLQSIDLESSDTFNDLHLVNRELPNLQRFHLHTHPKYLFRPENCQNVVRFANVREFHVSITSDDNLEASCIPLKFDKLETLQMLTVKLTHQWIGFIVRHKTLKNISMPWIEPCYEDLQAILGNVTELRAIDVQWMPKFGDPETNGIVEVMREENSLQKVTIWMNARRDFGSDFRALIPGTWWTSNQEVRAQRRFVTFERKVERTSLGQRVMETTGSGEI